MGSNKKKVADSHGDKKVKINKTTAQKKKNKMISRKLPNTPHVQAATSNQEKKKVGERFFTPEDDIAILRGLIDLKTQKQMPISSNLPILNLCVFPDEKQLSGKVDKLRKKYLTKARKGGQPLFKNEHEASVYDLSHQIWKEYVVEVPLRSNGSGHGHGHEDDITTFEHLFGKLHHFGLCGALSADLGSEDKKEELVLRLEPQMHRLNSARNMTASLVLPCQTSPSNVIFN